MGRCVFRESKMVKMTADAGADRRQVIPHPRYKPRIPCWFQMLTPSLQKVLRGIFGPVGMVCIRDLIVSAGKKMKLYDTPADAPAIICCHTGSGSARAFSLSACVLACFVLICRNIAVTVSLAPNQAADPPVSRISVPIWPCQKPLMPSWRKTLRTTAKGFKCATLSPT